MRTMQAIDTVYNTISKFRMWRIIQFCSALIIVLSIAGCSQERTDRLLWSGDGQRALVFASDGLRLTDADGKLTNVFLESAVQTAWMPDGKSFVASTSEEITSWDELKKFLSPKDEQRITEAVKQIKEFARTGKSFDKLSDQDEERFNKLTEDINASHLVLYFKTFESETLKKIQPPGPDLGATESLYTLRVYKLDANRAQPGPILYQTIHEVTSMRVSKGGEAIAIVEDGCLKALPTEGGPPSTVAEPISNFVDWTSDGKDVVYIRKIPGDLSIGSVERATLLRDGQLIKQTSPVVLAHSVFSVNARVQCTADGRIYFSSAQYKIPSDPKSRSDSARIYALMPGTLPSVISMLPDNYLVATYYVPRNRNDCQMFSASPNGKKLAILHDKGFVDVIDTATGDWIQAQDQPFPNEYAKAFLPQWRTDDELSFAGPPSEGHDSKRAAEVTLWSNEKARARIISKTWPAEAVGFLERSEDETKGERNRPLRPPNRN